MRVTLPEVTEEKRLGHVRKLPVIHHVLHRPLALAVERVKHTVVDSVEIQRCYIEHLAQLTVERRRGLDPAPLQIQFGVAMHGKHFTAQQFQRLGGVDVLDEAKTAWMEDDTWQGLRRFVEDSMVLKDPFELFVVQNVVLDGLLYPLVYETIIDDVLSAKGGTSVAMLTQFMTDWFAETKKWADATVKIAAAESEENKAILTKWIGEWRDRAAAALVPVARIALGDRTDELVGEVVQQFNARMAKAGVAL